MAHFDKVLAGKSARNARSGNSAAAMKSQHDKEQRLALEQQALMVARAQAPLENDPLQGFDSSMTRDQVRARFMKLVQRSRESVFA